MKKNTTSAILICTLFFLSLNNAKAQQFNTYLAAKLDSTLIAAVPQQVKGVSASIHVPGQGIWRGTYGVSYAGHPITPDMEFGIASNTKLFTATTIMKLVDANKLNLNDHVGKWIKKKYNNIDSTISIKQLLYHTSGLSDNSLEFFDSATKFPSRVFTVEEILGWQDTKFAAPSANKFNYSNTNYMLLGMIAETATGFHISKLIRDSILTPIGLDSTFYSYKETIIGTIAHPWISGIDKADTPRTGLNSASGAAGAIYSTAADMAKWYNALFSGQLVTASSLTQMTTFLTGANQFGFGMQKRVVAGITTWGHGGKTLGYLSEMFYEPNTKTVACAISNSDSASVAATGLLLLKTVIDNLPDTAKTITGNTTVCQGQSAVTYSVPAIAHATSYTWTLPNGATGSSQTNSITVNYTGNAVSGNITVSGTNIYGDGRTAMLAITVKAQPSSAVTSSGATSLCSGGSVVLTAGAGSSYLWSNNSTTQSIIVASSGNYSVTITGANGCSVTTPSTVVSITNNATPTVSIAVNTGNVICAGTNVVFTATPVNGGNSPTYQWIKNGVSVGNNNNIYADNNLKSYDSVWCILTSNLVCVNTPTAISNKAKFVVSSSPAIGTSTLTKATICSINGTVIANNTNTSGGGVWSSNNLSIASVANNASKASAVVTGLSNGSAILTYTKTTINGCASTADVMITVASVAAPIISTPPTSMCKSTSTSLSAAPIGGIWSSANNCAAINASSGFVTAGNAGQASISYTIANANGCTSAAIVNFPINPIPPVPTIQFAQGTVNPQTGSGGAFCTNRNFALVGNPGGGVWSSTGVISVNPATGSVGTGNIAGIGSLTYTITINGCNNSRSILGAVAVCPGGRSLNTLDNQESIADHFIMYPNPAKTFISLNLNTVVGIGSIVVTDLYGKQVKMQPLSMGNNTLDIASLSKGFYLVSIITEQGKTMKKLIVE